MILQVISPIANLGLTWGQIITVIVMCITFTMSLLKVWGSFKSDLAVIGKDIQLGKDQHIENKTAIETNRKERETEINKLSVENRNEHAKIFENIGESNKLLYEIKGMIVKQNEVRDK